MKFKVKKTWAGAPGEEYRARATRKVAAETESKARKLRRGRVRTKSTLRLRKLKIGSGMFLAPSVIGVLLFYVLPFIVVIGYSFMDNPISKRFVGLSNFIKIVKNGAFRIAVTNTATFSAVAVPLAVVLSLLLAMMLDSKLPGASRFRTMFLSPMMVPVASIVLIWQVLFHYNGAVNDLIVRLGGMKIDWFKSQYAQVVVIILFLWKNLGYNMILFMAALSSIPADLIEVARMESASSWQIFWTIKIRYLGSTILFVTIMSLISSFKVFREIYLLTGDHPYDSIYMLQHFMNNAFEKLDYQRLSAAAILMSIVMVMLVGLLFLIDEKFGQDVEG